MKLGFPEFTIDDFHENVSKTVTLTKNRSPIYRISILLNREKKPPNQDILCKFNSFVLKGRTSITLLSWNVNVIGQLNILKII